MPHSDPMQMMQAEEVAALRDRLGVDRATFAKVFGVDVRTVYRWEMGEVPPTGAALQIMVGFREKLRADPASADRIVEFVVGASDMGGLAYLVVKMLDAVTKDAVTKDAVTVAEPQAKRRSK